MQHGITVSDLGWLHYSETKISRFLCGAYPEYAYVKERYGYPEGSVRYTGFCRFDSLHAFETDRRLILIMPSWRNWLVIRRHRLRALEGTEELQDAAWFVRWREFLEDPALKEIAERFHVRFLFYPHRNMQQYLSSFPSDLPHVVLCRRENCDVQELLKRAALLVTDYSSVFFDMVYMKKPVIFYPFDYERFRQGQYREGWFDYANNPFGPCCRDRAEVYACIRRAIEEDFAVSDAYLEAHARSFPLYDADNCRRTWEIAREMDGEK